MTTTFEEIEAINPPHPAQPGHPQQHTSVLNWLIDIGAATPQYLCHGANWLEKLGPPNILCYAQVPIALNLQEWDYKLKSRRPTLVFDTRFSTIHLAFDVKGLLHPQQAPSASTDSPRLLRATQIIAAVRLHGTPADLYPKYLSDLSPTGPYNRILGPLTPWFASPEIAYRRPWLNSETFESELARRFRGELERTIWRFLRAYGLSVLHELPITDRTLYSYFVMTAPGRIAPYDVRPLITGLCGGAQQNCNEAPIPRSVIESHLQRVIPLSDRVVRQLSAMNALLDQGEAELALIGCVSAIEWYLNESFPHLRKPAKGGGYLSSSLNESMAKHPLKRLPHDIQTELHRIANTRNSIVHGPPPARLSVVCPGVDPSSFDRRIDPHLVRAVIHLVMTVYRHVNKIKKDGIPPEK